MDAPENNQELNPQTEENSEQPREEEGQATAGADLVDLSKYSRVKLGDKEWNRDELEKGVMFQSDYTKKTQEIAQERRYIENLEADLKSVSKNPALASEFRKIYPPKYHTYLDFVKSGTNAQQAGGQTPNPGQQSDPRLNEYLSKVENIERTLHEERVAQKATEIDAAFAKFQSKYPLSTPNKDETFVLARAQSLLEQGETLNDAKWEKIFKEAHSHFENAYREYYKTRNNNQKAAHVRGKEIASGGGVPGQAPNLPKTIKDATRIAMQDLGTK